MLDAIRKERKEAFSHLLEVRQQLLVCAENITENSKTVEACAEEARSLIQGYSIETKARIEDLRRRAVQRLRYYHYLFAKAWEYRLLTPYEEPLLLDLIYKDFEKKVQANEVRLSKADVDAMLVPYTDQLQDLTKRVIENVAAGQKQLSRLVDLSDIELGELNRGQKVKINLATREGFIGDGRGNRRIVSIKVSNVASNGDEGSIDIDIAHGGTSKIVKRKKSYVFRHLGYEGAPALEWIAVYNVKHRTTVTSEPSDADKSLLRIFTGINSDNVQYFAQPGLDSDFYISITLSRPKLQITSLSLDVTYSFE